MRNEEPHPLPELFRHRLAPPSSVLFGAAMGATALMVFALGFFLHRGATGLYMDDYSVKAWAFDFAANRWKLNLIPFYNYWRVRPLAHIVLPNLANAIPQHEFPVRFGIVVIHILNVYLIAKLAQRVTGSLFIGITCGACAAFPIFANEGLLWFSVAIFNTFSLLFLLLGFHLLLSCRTFRDLPLMVGGVVAWFLTLMFYESGLFIILLLPAFFSMLRVKDHRAARQVWASALAASFVPMIVYVGLVERNSSTVVGRGGGTLDIAFLFLHKIPDVARNVVWLVTDWGISGPLREALKLGWREWLAVPGGPLLIGASLLGICATALLFPVERDVMPASSHLWKLLLIGFAWIVLGLVPIVLVRSQIVEIRTLYIPSAGAAFSAAALSGLVVNLLRPWRRVAVRAMLLAAGTVTILSSLTMAGLVRTYQLRWYLDEEQVAALRDVISVEPPTKPLWLLPATLDERIVGAPGEQNATLNRYLFGVFEHEYSMHDAIRLKFGDRDIHAVTSQHWDKLHVTAVHQSKSGQVDTVTIQGEDVPVGRLVAFTYQRGELILLSPLEIMASNGASPIIINLPLATEIMQKNIKVQPVRFQLEDK